jgi:hypothetical protein
VICKSECESIRTRVEGVNDTCSEYGVWMSGAPLPIGSDANKTKIAKRRLQGDRHRLDMGSIVRSVDEDGGLT